MPHPGLHPSPLPPTPANSAAYIKGTKPQLKVSRAISFTLFYFPEYSPQPPPPRPLLSNSAGHGLLMRKRAANPERKIRLSVSPDHLPG